MSLQCLSWSDACLPLSPSREPSQWYTLFLHLRIISFFYSEPTRIILLIPLGMRRRRTPFSPGEQHSFRIDVNLNRTHASTIVTRYYHSNPGSCHRHRGNQTNGKLFLHLFFFFFWMQCYLLIILYPWGYEDPETRFAQVK